jgi:peroxiredoxin
MNSEIPEEALHRTSHDGIPLGELAQKPLLLVFLRHFGCTFCREALSDLSVLKESLEVDKCSLALVHMSEEERAERYFSDYGVGFAHFFSDPERSLYRSFNLQRGKLSQLFSLQEWLRGFDAGILKGHLAGLWPEGDGLQMPGVFFLENKKVVRSFIHKSASEVPNYSDLISRSSDRNL